MASNDILAGLDLGTNRTTAIIATPQEDGQLKVLGIGSAESRGIKKGVVVNLERTIQSIEAAVDAAEKQAQVEVGAVTVGIAGDHIKSINSRGVIGVRNPDGEITRGDVERVIEAARAIALPGDREIIHVLPQEFTVDDQGGIPDPVGMMGVRLETEVHVITGATTPIQNLLKCVRRAGLDVQDVVLGAVAAADAVLTHDEMELGVVLVDIGGGTIDVAVFADGGLKHTAVIGVGGSNVTNDIAIGLRTPLAAAEQIKRSHASLLPVEGAEEVLLVPGVNGRPERSVSREILNSIVRPRMEEILALSYREVKKTDYWDLLAAGLVLTGGGSLLEGTLGLAEHLFNLPAKHGIPMGTVGFEEDLESPEAATLVGLVTYAQRQADRMGPGFGGRHLMERVTGTMRRWVAELF
ncbi:cell division protein FtsA [bacterium]|nr:cell division protein FtsA [bacterium]